MNHLEIVYSESVEEPLALFDSPAMMSHRSGGRMPRWLIEGTGY